jgi:hypothetical protein
VKTIRWPFTQHQTGWGVATVVAIGFWNVVWLVDPWLVPLYFLAMLLYWAEAA